MGALGAFVWAIVDDGPDREPEPLAADVDVTRSASEMSQAAVPIDDLGPAPDLVDIEGWFNTDATSLESALGDVTIVQFWTFGCFNCKNTLPHLQTLYAQHREQGLEIVGVHAPEFGYEADAASVHQAIGDLGVTWPVALDTSKVNFHAWQPGTTSYWPRTYVVDQAGHIRFDHIGEGAYDQLADVVTRLLADGPEA